MGFRVWGLGFRDQGSRFRAQALGYDIRFICDCQEYLIPRGYLALTKNTQRVYGVSENQDMEFHIEFPKLITWRQGFENRQSFDAVSQHPLHSLYGAVKNHYAQVL